MEIKSIKEWFNGPVHGWIMILIGAVMIISGVYNFISAFYVNYINDYATPTALSALFAMLVIGFGTICIYLGICGRNTGK